jgi:hypothetical protein
VPPVPCARTSARLLERCGAGCPRRARLDGHERLPAAHACVPPPLASPLVDGMAPSIQLASGCCVRLRPCIRSDRALT